MPETPSPSSLTVLGGPLNGTRLVLDDLVDEILIGSDVDCRFCLDLPGVSPMHARIWMDLGGAKVYNTRSPRGLYVNDDPVGDEAPLKDGDVLWLGPPGDPESVMIQCRFAPPPAPAMAPEGFEAPEVYGAEELVQEAPERAPAAADEFLIEEPAAEPPAEATPAVVDAFRGTPEAPPAAEAEGAAASQGVEDLVLEEPAPAAEALAEPMDEAFFVEEPPAAPEAAPGFEAEPASAFDFEAPPEVAAEPEVMAEPEVAAAHEFMPAGGAVPETEVTAEAEDIFVVEEAEIAPPPPAPAPPPAAPARPAAAPAAPAPQARRPPVAPAAAAAPRPAAARPRKADISTGPEMAPGRERVAPAVGEAAAPRPRGKPAPKPPIALYVGIGAGVLLVLGGGGYLAMRFLSAPQLDGVNPARAKVGQAVTLTGKNFAADKSANQVFFGDKAVPVLKASQVQLEVEVPELPTIAGRDTKVPVTVHVAGRTTKPVEVAVFQSPRIHGIAPSVAMAGEEVVLQGTGWGASASVKFGSLPGEVLQATSTSLKVRVPALEGAPETSVPVVVVMGSDESNAAPFLLGHLPLVMGVEPRAASAGDTATVLGHGFQIQAGANSVQVSGVRALVLSANEGELKFVVPRAPAGEATVEVRVPGSDYVGRATFLVVAPGDPIDFRFVAEPYDDGAGHDHAVLATWLGPAFVLAASGGQSAAQRAVEAARRLNEAAVPLRASREADLEVRGIETNPVLALAGKEGTLLDVTDDDAAAYNEDWTKQGGKGGPVTRSRLALWWSAVARDLVLVLIRSEKPQYAQGLAGEGRIFADVFQAARKTGRFGLPQQVVAELKPPQREALRILALRVPASVAEPATATLAGGAAGALKLEGNWNGWEAAGGTRRYLAVSFRTGGGTFTYTGGVAVGLPLLSVETPQKGTVRFSVQIRGGTRYYTGKWDGEKMTGKIASDAGGKGEIGSFELAPGP